MSHKATRWLLVVCALCLVSACATKPQPIGIQPWMQEVLAYEASLGPDHPDTLDKLFRVPPQAKQTVIERFGKLPRLRAVRKLAVWLMDPEGRGMEYDIKANLVPADAYLDKRGNCLSFTLLLVQLASELDIELHINDVDIPDMWGEDDNRDLIYYRHVNAMFLSERFRQVFDLAIEEYGPGYPQRFISKRQAAALLFSNMGIGYLRQGELDRAYHYQRLAVSMDAKNPDLWINLASVFRRQNESLKAEQSYLYAASLNDRDSIAVSNLERLYRQQGKLTLAKKYEELAKHARQRNPYMHFKKARAAFAEQDYRTAKKALRKTIRLYDGDPQFYELRSRLHQLEENYIAALRDLEKAHNISKDGSERQRYVDKVNLVLARVKQLAEDRQLQRRRTRTTAWDLRQPNSIRN